MNDKKWRMAYSQERAVQYDDFIKAGAGPVHEQMLGSVAEALELTFQDRSLRILDMGTGTGSVAARILENHPNAKITCLDGSPDMLDQARKRLGADLRCDFVQRDFGEPSGGTGWGLSTPSFRWGPFTTWTPKAKRPCSARSTASSAPADSSFAPIL